MLFYNYVLSSTSSEFSANVCTFSWCPSAIPSPRMRKCILSEWSSLDLSPFSFCKSTTGTWASFLSWLSTLQQSLVCNLGSETPESHCASSTEPFACASWDANLHVPLLASVCSQCSPSTWFSSSDSHEVLGQLSSKVSVWKKKLINKSIQICNAIFNSQAPSLYIFSVWNPHTFKSDFSPMYMCHVFCFWNGTRIYACACDTWDYWITGS